MMKKNILILSVILLCGCGNSQGANTASYNPVTQITSEIEKTTNDLKNTETTTEDLKTYPNYTHDEKVKIIEQAYDNAVPVDYKTYYTSSEEKSEWHFSIVQSDNGKLNDFIINATWVAPIYINVVDGIMETANSEEDEINTIKYTIDYVKDYCDKEIGSKNYNIQKYSIIFVNPKNYDAIYKIYEYDNGKITKTFEDTEEIERQMDESYQQYLQRQ